MKMDTKQNLIARREKQRILLQIKNLATTMRCLKEDIEKGRGVGLSLPAVEHVAGKLGTAARAYQNASCTEKGWQVDKADEGLNKVQLFNQIQEIGDELKEIPYDLQHRLEDRKPGEDLEQDMIDDGTLTDPEKDLDQETKEIEDIEKELGKDDQTKIW